MKKFSLLLFLICLNIMPLMAQEVESTESTIVFLTGATIDLEEVQAVPFVTIFVKNRNAGTISDNNGYFSLIVEPGDTIVFRSVGYKTDEFLVPKTIEKGTFSLIHLMVKDDIILEEVVVTPFPTIDQFTQAILKLELPRDVQRRSLEAQQSIDQLVKDQFTAESIYYDQWRYNKLYNITGIEPPNNFINPMQWANFIRDWKEGKYKEASKVQQRMKRDD